MTASGPFSLRVIEAIAQQHPVIVTAAATAEKRAPTQWPTAEANLPATQIREQVATLYRNAEADPLDVQDSSQSTALANQKSLALPPALLLLPHPAAQIRGQASTLHWNAEADLVDDPDRGQPTALANPRRPAMLPVPAPLLRSHAVPFPRALEMQGIGHIPSPNQSTVAHLVRMQSTRHCNKMLPLPAVIRSDLAQPP